MYRKTESNGYRPKKQSSQTEDECNSQIIVTYRIASDGLAGHRKETGEVFSGFGPEAKRPNAGQKKAKTGDMIR